LQDEIDAELPHEISLKLYLGYTLCICVAERDFPVWQVWIARPAPISRLFQQPLSRETIGTIYHTIEAAVWKQEQ